jgi:small subunit ribosomal protein S6
MNTYESIFILRSTLSDEDVQKTVNKIEGVVKQGGELIAPETWGKKRLAYEVMKEKKGIYVLLRFRAKGNLVAEIERNYRIDDNVIKFLTVKLDKKEIELLKKKEMAVPSPQGEAIVAEKTEGGV